MFFQHQHKSSAALLYSGVWDDCFGNHRGAEKSQILEKVYGEDGEDEWFMWILTP